MMDLLLTNEFISNKYIFWKEKSNEFLPVILPADSNNPFSKDLVSSQEYFEIANADFEKYVSYVNTTKAEFQAVATTAFLTLLYRYTQQREIGTVIKFSKSANENQDENGSSKQCFVCININGNLTGEILFQLVNGSVQDAKANEITLEHLAEHFAGDEQMTRRIELLNCIKLQFVSETEFDYNSAEQLSGTISDSFSLPLPYIHFSLKHGNNKIAGSIKYNTLFYRKTTIQRLGEHFKNLFIGFTTERARKIGEIPMLTNSEAEEILVKFNDTGNDYSKDKTIITLFEEQVVKTPQNVAVKFKNQFIHYDALNRKANKIAHLLFHQGVKSGESVGLLTSRGFHMVEGLLGILKAGGAYVPIDPEYPIERQKYILENSKAAVVIIDDNYSIISQLPEVKFIDLAHTSIIEYSTENPNLKIISSQIAYTIYTSGSTGKPKGVMIAHHSAVNLIEWVNKTYAIGINDCLLCITSMCFDLSVYDIFGMLASGGSVAIADSREMQDVKKLPELIQQYGITFWDSVPTTLDYVVKGLEKSKEVGQLESLRLVFLSGDWIPVNLPKRIKKYFPNAKVISLGGATEGTVWSNYFPIDKVDDNWKSIPYGKPIQNNTFYILNEQLQPVPFQVEGELFIGGVGVALGYANDKEKTEYSYLKDPFNSQLGGRMYRTGDLGRMLPDLNMEFLGRKDTQVKIRGFRVELGEIETVILKTGWVHQVVVIAAKDKDGTNRIVAYVVPKKGFEKSIVIEEIKSLLPDYMLPFFWMELETLPLNANGKIDRKALPAPDTESVKGGYIPPQTELEIKLADIWQEVLGLTQIGIEDNFFDMGGQSLIAVQLISEIENRLNKKLNIYTLFKYPTIRELAVWLQKAENTIKEKVWKSLTPIKPTGSRPPLYIVHGDGLNFGNFNNLSELMHPEQPMYSLQPLGLHSDDKPLDNIPDIAKQYITEILDQNPDGPYAIAGYSFGGYVAVEMHNQLKQLGKEIKLLAIFDTDALNTEYNKSFIEKLPKKLKRQLPKLKFIVNSMIKNPAGTLEYQKLVLKRKLDNVLIKAGLKSKPELKGIDLKLNQLNDKHVKAFKKYRLNRFDGYLHLFKAKTRIYFVDDFKYLGWTKFAIKGVNVIDVPGDHKTMFLPPNVSILASELQKVLDKD